MATLLQKAVLSFSIWNDLKYFASIPLQILQNDMQPLQVWASAEYLAPKIMVLDVCAFSWFSGTCDNVD